jgi:gliding motility-associated-like protein
VAPNNIFSLAIRYACCKITIPTNSKKSLIIIGINLIILLLSTKGYTQSLGDPIIDITFGSGAATHAGALSPDSGATTYTYSNGTPNDGFYSIVNNTAGLNPSWWATTDHTGNLNGYMLLVNGSYDPGIFYTRIVTGLCGNTQYQFAAWIKSMLNKPGILPNVTFSIETTGGAVIASGNTGDIPMGNTWKQYPFTFTTPVNGDTVVIKMTNNAPGGVGNDIAIDDITFRPYGSLLTAVFANTLTTQTSCLSSTQTINVTTPLIPGNLQKVQELVNGVWIDQTPASASSSFTVQSSATVGTYYYRIISGLAANINTSQCVIASSPITLITTLPVAAFSAPDNTCLDTPVDFTDQSTSINAAVTSWLWDFGDGQTSVVQNPSHLYAKAGSYTVNLSVTNSAGCTVSATSKTIQISAPTASFTYSAPDITSKTITLIDRSTTTGGTITSWLWDYGDGTTETRLNNQPFQHTYASTGTYLVKLLVTNSIGCTSVNELTIYVLNPLQITNTFTPNGDGVNDTWTIQYLDTYVGCTIDIFNRYGIKLFSSTGYPAPWNGQYNNRDVPSGVYYYVIDPKHGQKLLSGWVAVIR